MTTGAGPARGPAVEAGLEPDFRQPAITGTALDAPNAFATETYVPGEGMARWRVSEMAIARPAVGAVDAVRISIGQVVRRPGGLPPEQDQWSEADTEAYQVTYTRGWPALMAVDAGEYDLDFTPHAGVGISNGNSKVE